MADFGSYYYKHSSNHLIFYHPCSQEQVLYRCKQDNQTRIVNTPTDNFFVHAYSDASIYESFKFYWRCTLSSPKRESNVIFCLNIRIIQTAHGISYDQTEHTRERVARPRVGEDTNTAQRILAWNLHANFAASTAGLPFQYNYTKKSFPKQTRKATINPRPPLKSS